MYDITAADAVETRFGIDALEIDEDAATTIVSMPVANMRNPSTGAPTIAALALLVDDAGSIVNFSRRQGRWPITSELAIDYSPAGLEQVLSNDTAPVTLQAHVVASTPDAGLASCDLRHAGIRIAAATVRSLFMPVKSISSEYPDETLVKTADTSLAELLAVTPLPPRGSQSVLAQRPDPMVLNAMGTVHGGIAATGLELVAHAAINAEQPLRAYRTGSLRVNFLRPLVSGSSCRYIATAVKAGSTVAIADAWAEGDDGATAVMARLTAYADGSV